MKYNNVVRVGYILGIHCLFLVAISLVPGLSFAQSVSPYLLHNGTSDYAIALQENASPSEKFSAEEFSLFFKSCTGVQLPVKTVSHAGEQPLILLGFGTATQDLGITGPESSLGEQGYLIRTVGPHLVIAGTQAAGTLYGVYDFLENHLGVRWYAPGETYTPKVDNIPLPALDLLKKPAFLWRHTSYAWPGRDEAFQARARENHGEGGADSPFGIQHSHDGRCHSYFRFISPDEYFEQHPEYFSEIGGVRRSQETQLCLTNTEVLDIVTEKMLQRMKEMPNARQHNFSQMDYYNYCECSKCAEINKKYATMGGTQFWFVNQLAERTSKVYPDKMIGTLAYMYTEEPPAGLQIHPNVAVWLCHMFPSCDSHPIASCPLNAEYKRRAEAWSKICSHLYVWHYIVDFAHYYVPFPNFRAIAADMKFYRDIGVEGIYLQGMGNGGGGGEFSLLRPWYALKLAWDPDLDSEALLKDFLQGYYGESWQPIHEYISMLHDKVQQDNIHMHLYTNPAQGYLPDEVMERANSLFDTAENLAKDNEQILERVRVARMPLVYANCFPRNGYRIENQTLLFNPPLADLDAISAFVKRMEQHGFKDIREIQGDPNQLLLLGFAFSQPFDAPMISNEFLDVDVVPFLGGRVLRILDRTSGKSITGYNITRNLFYPFCGGEETRLGGVFNPEGMFYQFGVSEISPDAITVLSESGKWLVTRRIALQKGAPIVKFDVEVQNLAEGPREAIVRTHTNFDLGSLESLQARFRNRAGTEMVRDAKSIIAGLREGEHYRDLNAPESEWQLTGDKGLRVVQRFDGESLDFAWLYAFPDYLNDLEAELWAKPVLLQSRESNHFRYSIEVSRKEDLPLESSTPQQ